MKPKGVTLLSRPLLSRPKIVVVSSSVSEKSRSRLGAAHALAKLTEWGTSAHWLDLAGLDLAPYPRSEKEPALVSACELFNSADGWFIATPVYNFNISGTLLTFLHYALAGDQGVRWRPFVLLASMDGLRAGMALDHLGRTLLHERASVAVGPPLIGIGDQLDIRTGRVSPDMDQRMELSLRPLVHFARARLTLDEYGDGPG